MKPSIYSIVDTLLESAHRFSCTMINVPDDLSDFIVNWGKVNIPDQNIYTEEGDDSYGRELETHVTVKFGLTIDVPTPALKDIINTTKPFPVRIGKVALFRNEKFDVLKLNIDSSGMRVLNARIRGRIPNEENFPSYMPHTTIAYCRKGTVDDLEGRDIFDQEGAPSNVFTAMELIFSDKERTKVPMPFQRAKLGENGPFDHLPFPTDPAQLNRGKLRIKKLFFS